MTNKLLSHCFRQYDQFLLEHSSFWQFSSFTCSEWPWEQAASLQQQINQALAQLPRPVIPLPLNTHTVSTLPFWLTNAISGRKLAQINGFIQQFDSQQPVLEWCAGKGHLGRLLSFDRQLAVRSIEWQQTLCEQGQQLAQRYQLAQQFQHSDVMQLDATSLPADHTMIALHACGDLHRRLLERFTEVRGNELFLAPCCYHLQAANCYQPMSALARQSALQLAKVDLKLAVQELVTGGQRVERLRTTEQLWRIIFQLYRSEVSGDASYQPLPSVAKQLFTNDIAQFMAWACQQQGLIEPSRAELIRLQPLAQQRLQLVYRIDQIRHLFRRPLELWLLLDRALFLEQHGYQVELREFCQYQDSPRNTLIIAKR
jgi:hypothetical protein